MPYSLRAATDRDAPALAEVFNYFVKNSFAAYPSIEADESMYQRLKNLAGDFPFYMVLSPHGKAVGFALIRRYHLADTLSHTGEITIFLLPDFTHRGIGTAILKKLEQEAKERGLTILMANASSKNQPSIDFQKRNGFEECGRFRRVGRKFGEEFDLVWMQKFL